jgi:hypothetical protein
MTHGRAARPGPRVWRRWAVGWRAGAVGRSSAGAPGRDASAAASPARPPAPFVTSPCAHPAAVAATASSAPPALASPSGWRRTMSRSSSRATSGALADQNSTTPRPRASTRGAERSAGAWATMPDGNVALYQRSCSPEQRGNLNLPEQASILSIFETIGLLIGRHLGLLAYRHCAACHL